MNKLVLFFKGIMMGIADLIPGISGGTIALITGIYSRMINAVQGISPKIIIDFFKWLFKRDKESLDLFKEDIKRLDPIFLIILGLGIWTSIFVGSRIIKFLLENFFVYTLSFFIGLIIASSKAIYNKIERHHTKNKLFGLIGLGIGVVFTFLIPANIAPGLWYVFLSGFLAISAMFLPGISGAFILLILGMYEFMIDVLHDIFNKFSIFLVFGAGALLGMFTISRVVGYLFEKDRCKTLYVLLGLVIGSLSIPIKNIIINNGSWNILNIITLLLFLILGLMSGRGLDKLGDYKL
jgi:putative membrane protein